MNPSIVPFKDFEFDTLMKEVRGYTLVDNDRCAVLFQFIKTIQWLQGDLAEVGVYKGGTAKLIGKTIKQFDKNLYLFDTFEGMPVTDATKDVHKQGDFKDADFIAVTKYLSDCKYTSIQKGFFPVTGKVIENRKFCFVHVDVDIYQSVKDCCEFFYPRMVEGGVMIFDDYGFPSCPGAKTAVDEFFRDKQEKPIYLTTGQCVVTKIKKVIPTETDKCRSRVMQYCNGTGIDAGCGGNKIKPDAVGIDIRKLDGVTIVRDAADINGLFPDGTLDYVYSSHFLEHVDHPVDLLKQWWRALKPGGFLVLYLPHPFLYTIPNPEHKTVYKPAELLAEMIHVGHYEVMVNQTYSTNNEYSFEMVLKKIGV